MKKLLLAGLVLVAAPLAAVAMPNVGDTVGTNPAEATAALQTAGCVVQDFEAEGGKIEAVCKDDTGATWEIYINPQTGAIEEIKEADD